jgi:L-alanine-DL-glutamate epimerase-like enolase superfamily enzyme
MEKKHIFIAFRDTMKIVKILEQPVRLKSNISNSLVNFATHTVSVLAVVTDKIINGKPATGLAFNSIGRFDQSGILRNRMIPRLLSAKPDSLLNPETERLCPAKVLKCAMQNEKPGGHGDRAHAASALEIAIWDLNAKLEDEPAAITIARSFGRRLEIPKISVYAAGGYYYEGQHAQALQDELKGYRDSGFTMFKMKIGGASMAEDIQRIESALSIAGAGTNLAVDANGRFGLDQAIAYGQAMQPYALRWYEEAGDPLDYDLNRQLADAYTGPLATGENLFSRQDVKNLVMYAGMRPSLDIFQMDPGLSYGITEYAAMLTELEKNGYDRTFAYPHGGQLMGFHVVAGLGLGGCEVYPGVFQPMGGFQDGAVIENGMATIPDTPGFGFERKANLAVQFAELGQ